MSWKEHIKRDSVVEFKKVSILEAKRFFVVDAVDRKSVFPYAQFPIEQRSSGYRSIR